MWHETTTKEVFLYYNIIQNNTKIVKTLKQNGVQNDISAEEI